jgi:predicted DNA-binding antitoxin AbrB/MazE fold protein
MAQTIRAIYENGRLRPLEPVDLTEGQEIQLTILSEEERVRAALGDLLVPRAPVNPEEDEIDEEALMREIEEGFRGITVSDVIIEERREGW